MTEILNQPIHPGKYVKENILPEGMTIKKAAELMGIGRPALSNFLNGKAQLSQSMTTRLVKAFDADKSKLVTLQQEYEAYLNQENEKRIAVRSYAPSFLNIRATHIDAWAEKHEARSLLPALLRRLVNSTGSEVTYCDFPAYDNSQRKGWDGKVEASNATPWVPSGVSGWEFGCNQDPTTKANDDYKIRTKNVSKEERKNTTFVFVTPRNWKEKNSWIREKKSKNEWKAVNAFDANDIEQWLELSVSGQAWLAEKLGLPKEGCQTLDDYWQYWSETAKPPISKKIFDSAVTVHGKKLIDWLNGSPNKPFVITAGSKEEALAFIACIADGLDELSQFNQQTILISKGNTIKRLISITTDFIPIAHTDEAERELVTLFNNRYAIIVADKSIKGIEPDIIVELPSFESFRDALTEMGFNDAEREILSSQSGKSPTILRRQLANIPILKKPAWAISNEKIQMMVPLVLAGTWKSNQQADQEILKCLSDKDYIDVEKDITELVNIDDAPIWSEGKYRGVVSKLDCFHAISGHITENDLDNLFLVAELVLSEDDPSLDLDKDKRWMANAYDKVRDHSNAIRESLCETLIILSIHGDGLFGTRLGMNVESHVTVLIRKLISNQLDRVWQSQQGELPMYAEAAPDEFLDIVEFELTQDEPAFAPLFEPVDSGLFSRCDRTGMLWALELLAWKPSRLARVAKILAQLCEFKLEDNWANKPSVSLKDILLSWMPHTAATVEQRCDVLELICREYPEAGWNICVGELKPGQGFTSGTYRPRWRSDASGVGQGVTIGERNTFLKKCQDLVLSWNTHTYNTLSDLITCLTAMNEKDQKTVEEQIQIWLESSPSDEEIIKLREHVRTHTMTQRARKRIKNKPGHDVNGKKLYELLEPKEIIQKHQWLFAKQWVEYTPEELEEDDFDFEAREARLSEQRITALKEILKSYGDDGAIKLCLKGEAGYTVGFHLARDIMKIDELHDYFLKCLCTNYDDSNYRVDSSLSGALTQLDDQGREEFLNSIINKFDDKPSEADTISRLLIKAPFKHSTWNILEKQSEQVQKEYWEKVIPGWSDLPPEDFNFFINKLIKANRPRAAFDIVHLKPGRVESPLLIELLHEVATNTSEPAGHNRVAQYEIEQALESLNGRDDVDRSELSRLEYLYIPALTPISKYGIPNLSKDVSESPLLFIQLLAICFKRDDNGIDPKEWNLTNDPELKKQAWENVYNVLEYANVIPGTQEDETIDVEQLRNWVVNVRTLAEQHGRKDIADQRIGKILSSSEADTDGIWPRKEIRQVFEDVASNEISIGMEIGLRNKGGAEWRPQPDDGAPERNLAEKYRNMAKNIMNKTPFVARMLNRIADSYIHDAEWHDTDGRVRERLRS